jgi:hypothetical protein
MSRGLCLWNPDSVYLLGLKICIENTEIFKTSLHHNHKSVFHFLSLSCNIWLSYLLWMEEFSTLIVHSDKDTSFVRKTFGSRKNTNLNISNSLRHLSLIKRNTGSFLESCVTSIRWVTSGLNFLRYASGFSLIFCYS